VLETEHIAVEDQACLRITNNDADIDRLLGERDSLALTIRRRPPVTETGAALLTVRP
jgi:hypothetical protein